MGWFDGWFGSKDEDEAPEQPLFTPTGPTKPLEIEPEPDGDLAEMRLGLNAREAVRNYYDKNGLERPGYQEIDRGGNAVANGYWAEQQSYLEVARIARDPARAADAEQAKAIMAWYENDMKQSFGAETTEKMLQMYFPERAKKEAAPGEAAAVSEHYSE